uniref:Uncharacterized protein n=1 Tax=Anopheles christyi TaxID=43041 RepID=A0A182KIQ8_9DIPT
MVDAGNTTATVRRLTSHVGIRTTRGATSRLNLSVVGTAHRTETDRRRNRLGIEIVHTVVRTDTGNIQDASRLGATSVRVEVSVRQWLIKSKQTGIREDCFRVLRIIGTEQIGLSVGEQGTSWVQTYNSVQLSVLMLSSVCRHMRTQAVTDQVNVVAGCTSSRHDGVDHARNHLTDSAHPVAGGNVVDCLRSCTPVHVHDVELTDADEVILDAPVQAGILTLQETVNQEAGRMSRIEVASGH